MHRLIRQVARFPWSKGHLKSGLLLILILTPLAWTVIFIHRYGLTIPYWDQWEFVPLLCKIKAGDLSFRDLWAQHNEHRILFPKLLMLSMAWLTGWNLQYELYANLALSALIFFFLYSLLTRTLGKNMPGWLVAATSFLVFSPVQYENWSWGWQIQIFLCVLCTVITIWTISRWPGQVRGALIGIGAAAVATFSFNNGLLAWVAGGMLLLVEKDRKWTHLTFWTVAFLMTTILYYHGYVRPSHHGTLSSFLYHPRQFVLYVLAYLGSPVGVGKKEVAVALSALSLVVLGGGVIQVFRSGQEGLRGLLPWLALAAFGMLSGAATGIGRIGFGVDQALSSRYTTISTLFVLSVLVVGVQGLKVGLASGGKTKTLSRVLVYSFLLLVAFSYTLTFFHAKNAFVSRKKYIESVSAFLENPDVVIDGHLKVLYPDAATVRERIKMLHEHGVLKRQNWTKMHKVDGGLMFVDLVDGLLYGTFNKQVLIPFDHKETFEIKGWAVDDKNKDSGKSIYVVLRCQDNGKQILIPTRRDNRPDVAKFFKKDGYLCSGWVMSAKTDFFNNRCWFLSVRILRNNGKEYFELDAEKPICFRPLSYSERG